jgi:hypothetical protein
MQIFIQAFVSATDGVTLITSAGPTEKHSHSHGVHHHGIDKDYQTLALVAALLSIGVKEG